MHMYKYLSIFFNTSSPSSYAPLARPQRPIATQGFKLKTFKIFEDHPYQPASFRTRESLQVQKFETPNSCRAVLCASISDFEKF